MSSGLASEPPLSLPPEMLRELASAGVEADQVPSLEQWQTLLLRFAHRFRDEPSESPAICLVRARTRSAHADDGGDRCQ